MSTVDTQGHDDDVAASPKTSADKNGGKDTTTTASTTSASVSHPGDDDDDDDDDDIVEQQQQQQQDSHSNGISRGTLDSSSSTKKSLSSSSSFVGASRMSQTHAPAARRVNSLRDFTLNKLRYQAVGLYGREEQVKILQQALQNGSPLLQQRQKQLVLIGGTSGTGKSRLAATVTQYAPKVRVSQQQQHCGCLCVKGKFDFQSLQTPYAGMALACGEICGHVLSLSQQQQTLREEMTQALEALVGHDELRILT